VFLPGPFPIPISGLKALDEEEDRLLHDTVNRRLDQALPGSFKPDLRQFDDAVRSLELR
jgi:hypothetical protein